MCIIKKLSNGHPNVFTFRPALSLKKVSSFRFVYVTANLTEAQAAKVPLLLRKPPFIVIHQLCFKLLRSLDRFGSSDFELKFVVVGQIPKLDVGSFGRWMTFSVSV
jgi:hypothetical protein